MVRELKTLGYEKELKELEVLAWMGAGEYLTGCPAEAKEKLSPLPRENVGIIIFLSSPLIFRDCERE